MFKRVFLIPAFILGSFLLSKAQDEGNIWNLKRCLEYAQENNIQLKQSYLNMRRSEIDLAQAKAARLPNLNGSSSIFSRFGYSIDPFTNQFQSANSQTIDAGLSSGINLFNGFQITNTIKQSKLDLAAREADLEQQEYDLALNITLAYLQILQNAELVESAKLQVGSTQEQRARTEKLVKAGSLPQSDLFQIESQIATEELNVVNAQNQLEMAYLLLQQILTLDPGEPFGIEKLDMDNPEGQFLTTPINEIYQYAEAHQPSIKSAELGIRSADIGIEIAKGNLYPSLSLFGSLGTGYSSGRTRFVGLEPTDPIVTDVLINDVPSVLTAPDFKSVNEKYAFADQISDNVSSSLSLQLSIPIYNRRQIKSAIEQAEIGLENARYTQELASQNLKQTIQQAYVDLKSAYSSYTATQKQLRALELTFENTEKQFNLGVVNSVDYLLSKNNLNRAKNDLLRTKYAYIFRTKVLDFYQGKPLGF